MKWNNGGLFFRTEHWEERYIELNNIRVGSIIEFNNINSYIIEFNIRVGSAPKSVA